MFGSEPYLTVTSGIVWSFLLIYIFRRNLNIVVSLWCGSVPFQNLPSSNSLEEYHQPLSQV